MKLKGVGESFKKYPDYESKGIKAHFNLDESGVLSLVRVSADAEPVCWARAQASPAFPKAVLHGVRDVRNEKGLGVRYILTLNKANQGFGVGLLIACKCLWTL